MAELRWFLLKLDSSGKVLSCTPVDQQRDNGASWVYIQATDAKAAQRAALNAYMRDVMRRRRAELDKAGKCRWCGRKADRGTKRCSVCLAKDSSYSRRHQAKQRGETVEPLDRKLATAARKLEDQQAAVAAAKPSVRLAVLLEVHDAWTGTSTNGGFTAWLVREIEAAGGKRRAG